MDDYEKLYKAVSDKFDIGSYEDFNAKMQSSEDRKKFYEIVSSKGFDLGDYNSYESRLKKKEQTQQPIGSSTPTANWRVLGGSTQQPSRQGMPQPQLGKQDVATLQRANQGLTPTPEPTPQTVERTPLSEQEQEAVGRIASPEYRKAQSEDKAKKATEYSYADKTARVNATQGESYKEYAEAHGMPTEFGEAKLYPTVNVEEANRKASEFVGADVKVYNEDGTPTEIKQVVDDYADASIGEYQRAENDIVIQEAREQSDYLSYFPKTSRFAGQLYQGTRNITDPFYLLSLNALSSAGIVSDDFYESQKNISEFQAAVANYRQKMLSGINEQDLNKGTSELLEEGNISDALTVLLGDMYAQIPQIAAMTTVGAKAGSTLLGASSAASHFNSVADRPDLTTSEKILQSVLLGGAEALSERVFQTDVKLWQGALKSKGISTVVKSAVEEGLLEEGSVGLLEQIINYQNNGEFNKYAIADAILTGTGMGAAPAVASYGVSAIGSHINKRQKLQLEKLYGELNKELSTNKNLSPTEKTQVRAAIKENIKAYNDLVKKDFDLYNSMEQKDVLRTIEINQSILETADTYKKMQGEAAKSVLQKKMEDLYEEKKAIEGRYMQEQQDISEIKEMSQQNVILAKETAQKSAYSIYVAENKIPILEKLISQKLIQRKCE